MADGIGVLICGLGRCGTSAVMRMLEAGGHPVHGTAPAYEPDTIFTQGLDAERGAAIKIIDPHYCPQLPKVTKAVWLNRDTKQQALSQLRFMGVPENRRNVRTLSSALRAERSEALSHLEGMEVLRLSFETIINTPTLGAGLIARHLSRGLDEAAMAAVIHRRRAAALDEPIEWQAA